MVYHAGINLQCEKIVVYDSVKKQIQKLQIEKVFDKNDDVILVTALFDLIKTNVGDNLGCACIYITRSYSNNIRKKCIEIGLKVGFKKVGLINYDSSLYLGAIGQTSYKPNTNDIIWIFNSRGVFIWYKIDDKAQFIEFFSYDYNNITWKENVNNLIKFSKLKMSPSAVFYKTKCEMFEKCTGLDDLECLKYSYEKFDDQDSALIKSRIIANDPEVSDLDVYSVLQDKVNVILNEKELFSFLWPQRLPITKTIVMKRDEDVKIIKIGKETIALPDFDEYLIEFAIDANEIYNVTFQKLPHVNGQIKISESFEKPVANNQSYIACDVFFMPKRVYAIDIKADVVGIDLGTSRCCAAVNRKNGIETVALENTGGRLLPSYVAFDEEKEKCGQIVVDRLRNHAKSSVFDAKRLIGKNFNEIKIDKSWTFEVKNKSNDIQIHLANGKIITPENVSAALLKHIKIKVEEFQGKKLTEAVLTVPAAFNESQKQSTLEAAKTAGWEKIHLLPEPVAAAFAYFFDRPIANNSTLLLFDLGGGTLDVCIFKIENDQLKILCRSGDPNIGGRDFDTLLIEYFEKKLVDEFNVDIAEKMKYKLMLKCQNIKENLTTILEDHLDVNDFDESKDGLIEITRELFEQISQNLLQKIKVVISSALNKASVYCQGINIVLQVGGACRMPMIKRMLEKMFKKAMHCCEEHPDEVVAVGAAYYACYLKSETANTTFLSPVIHKNESLSFNSAISDIRKTFTEIKNITEILYHFKKPKQSEQEYSSDKKILQYNNSKKEDVVKKNSITWLEKTNNIYTIPKKQKTYDPDITAVGIDLGTSKCCVAVNQKSGITTVPLDNTGERLLPSFVAYDEKHVKCGQIVLERLRNQSKSTVFDSKRIIGRSINDIEIDTIWPFKLIPNDNKISLGINDSKGVTNVNAEQVSAELLKHIKEKTEAFQGKSLSSAVITVPAAFTEAQKIATKEAAKIAGWNSIELLPEPIAAALAYFIDRPIPNNSTVLLFDLGGGTLDVCIFKIFNNQIHIISNIGDTKLGGRDFDAVLINHFRDILDTKYAVTMNRDKKYKLMIKCQKLKENLSLMATGSLDIDEFDPSQDGIISISREEFQLITTPLLNKIRNALNAALFDARCTANQINKILQVGGGSRMPIIKQFLKDTFPQAEHCAEENPDEVVALGAAYYSYHLATETSN